MHGAYGTVGSVELRQAGLVEIWSVEFSWATVRHASWREVGSVRDGAARQGRLGVASYGTFGLASLWQAS